MRPVTVTVRRKPYELAYTVGAAIKIQDAFGSSEEMLAVIEDAGSVQGAAAVCRAAAILMEQAELVRRYMGHEPSATPLAAYIAAHASKDELEVLKIAIPAAVIAGLHHELEDENEEIDLGLQELNEEKDSHIAPALFYRMGAVNGFTKKETLLSTPGELGDLWSLYLKAHGIKRKTDMD